MAGGGQRLAARWRGRYNRRMPAIPSPVLALVVGGALLLVYLAVTFNRFVRLGTKAKEAFSGVDVQLKRRYDLIPNLIETVKGYAAHEKGTREAVVEARNQAMSTTGREARGEAENVLTGALKSLFALAESYPQLRAVESFNQLQSTLTEIEGAIQSSRRYYNAVVRDYNTKLQVFPSNLVANAFRFQLEEFFEMEDDEQREAPKVSFE